jgi:hypothetical protein
MPMNLEMRAPGWQVRCTEGGFTEPWGLYGIRLTAVCWKKYTVAAVRPASDLGFTQLKNAQHHAPCKTLNRPILQKTIQCKV